ncbi:hypothetical protein GCM10007359_19360 [Rothia aerolata]|uniref:Uncharacterized protein n=1 Tax=Rothia aerolata TaxID=1812262 RepID=A0A917IWH6_9MICC|nr:hypothetical protein GCM10007359_19360 [Rothia aerolata]
MAPGAEAEESVIASAEAEVLALASLGVVCPASEEAQPARVRLARARKTRGRGALCGVFMGEVLRVVTWCVGASNHLIE